MLLGLKWAYEDDPVAFPAFLFLGLGLIAALGLKGLIILSVVALAFLAVWGFFAGAAWLQLQWQD